MALTASAPPSIEVEVKAILQLRDCVTVSLPLDWPNIYISAKKKSSLCELFPSCESLLRIMFNTPCIQRDLGGFASSMRSCSSPAKNTSFFIKQRLSV